MNIARMARTNERMCIPELPGDLFLAAVRAEIFKLLKEHIDEALLELSDFNETFGERGNDGETSDD